MFNSHGCLNSTTSSPGTTLPKAWHLHPSQGQNGPSATCDMLPILGPEETIPRDPSEPLHVDNRASQTTGLSLSNLSQDYHRSH